MKAVLISVQPRWCERIASRDKTDEIRKNAPKLPVPFKCYIYQSRDLWGYPILRKLGLMDLLEKLDAGKGKVIAEFTCDAVAPVTVNNDKDLERTACLSRKEMWRYAAPNKSMFDLKAWHISDLVIYEKPKLLSEFSSYNCSVYWEDGYPMPTHEIKRPPQSWCYVEELNDGY